MDLLGSRVSRLTRKYPQKSVEIILIVSVATVVNECALSLANIKNNLMTCLLKREYCD